MCKEYNLDHQNIGWYAVSFKQNVWEQIEIVQYFEVTSFLLRKKITLVSSWFMTTKPDLSERILIKHIDWMINLLSRRTSHLLIWAQLKSANLSFKSQLLFRKMRSSKHWCCLTKRTFWKSSARIPIQSNRKTFWKTRWTLTCKLLSNKLKQTRPSLRKDGKNNNKIWLLPSIVKFMAFC